MKKMIKKLISINRFWILPIFDFISRITFKLNYLVHKLVYFIEWCPPEPKYIDRYSNLSYTWINTRNPMWLERGVFNNFFIKKNGVVLDLACGDGFNTRNFYSMNASKIIGVDVDEGAIKKAKTKNSGKNISYQVMDLKKDFPKEKFDNIILDAVLQHFNENETKKLFTTVKNALTKDGIFSGNTIDKVDCKNKEELRKHLKPFFKKVYIYETNYPDRTNLYFVASNKESFRGFNPS